MLSQVAGELDDQQVWLEQRNTALIQQDAGLIELLSQDAAGLSNHQVTIFCMLYSINQKELVIQGLHSQGKTNLPDLPLFMQEHCVPFLLTEKGRNALA